MDVEIENNIEQIKNLDKEQKKFIETTLGQTINAGLDIGLRVLLPDIIENQIIDIKDTILEEGFSNGIKKTIDSAIDFGKSVIGIFTGNFQNVTQVHNAVKNGGIIDGISNLLDTTINKIGKTTKIPYSIQQTIKKGKNVILNSISNNIETQFNSQLASIEKIQKYSNQWKDYYKNKDFEGMQKEYDKMKKELKNIIPLETTIKEARQIENIHTLIKNNNKNFNLSKEQLQLAQVL